MTSGDELKRLNGLSGLLRLGINPPYPQRLDRQSGAVSLTTPPDGLLFELACMEGRRSRLELGDDERIIEQAKDTVVIGLKLLLPLRGGRKLISRSKLVSPQPNDVLIAALRKAHAMLSNERGFPVIEAAPASPYDRKILRLAFLAPDIQQAIMSGRQPPHLFLEMIQYMPIPLSWKEQRIALGFQDPKTGL